MALAILTTAQGGTCAIVHADYCLYIADNKTNIHQALSALTGEITGTQCQTGDPLQEWWAWLSSSWR